jgi:hypothetical protein
MIYSSALSSTPAFTRSMNSAYHSPAFAQRLAAHVDREVFGRDVRLLG